MATINGDGTNNTLTGTGTADSINGLGGHDTIDGGGGNDAINGGSGDDVLTGGTGNDTLIGGAGTDSAIYAHMLQSQTPVGTWSPTSATLTIVTAGEGTDTLTTIETIVFNGVSFTVNNATKNVVARLANDTASVNENAASVDGNVLSNDLDVDSVLSVGGLTGGTLGVAKAGTYGSLTLNANGTYSYVPTGVITGDTPVTDTFTYSVTEGGVTHTATLTITVQPQNDAPVAQNVELTTAEDPASPIAIDVLTGATDEEGNTLSVSLLNGEAFSDSLYLAGQGTVSLAGGGNLQFVPDANFNGDVVFTYALSDGNSNSANQTVTLHITAVNDDPVANDGSDSVDEDAVLTGSVSASDVDGDTLTYALGDDVTNGVLVFNTDGSFSYTPGENFNGSDSFTYSVSDGNGGTDTGTFTITVDAVNDAPVATDDSTTLAEDAATYSGAVSATDLDGDTLTFSLGDDVAHGTLVFNANGTFDYTPNANFNGEDSFTWSVSDGNGGTDTGTFTITVTPVADAPVAADGSDNVDEDAVLTGSVSATDGDDDVLTYTLGDDVAHGVLVFNTDGSFSYTPGEDFNGSDSFTYSVSDGNGGTDTGTFTITVDAVNDGPSGTDDTTTLAEDATTYSGAVSATDVDGDSLTYSLGDDVANGTLVFNADGTFDYTPNADFNGEDSFTWSVSDGNGGTDTGTFTINVTPVADAPVAADGSDNVDEDAVLTGSVSASDVDGDTLTYTLGDDVAHGVLVLNTDGSFSYTPGENFNGSDSFTYSVSDGNGGTDTGTFTITVDAVNDAPVADDDGIIGVEDAATYSGAVSATDVDGDSLTYSLGADVAHGTLVFNPDGTFDYTPDADFNGEDSFTWSVSDGNGGTDTGTFTITLTPVNDAPVAADGSGSLDEDAVLTGSVSATDVDLDTLTYTVDSDVAHGVLVLNTDGSFSYTPGANYNGSDSFTYTVSDGNGGTDTGTFTITVDPVADVAQAPDFTRTILEDAATIVLEIPQTDPDGDAQTVTHVDGAPISALGTVAVTGGSVFLNGDGDLEFTPDANFHGQVSFQYELSSADTSTANGQVEITVTSVNDDPVASDGSDSINEDSVIALTGVVGASDVDLDTLTYSLASGGDVSNGTLVLNPDGSFEYTPDPDFSGTDSFTFEASDGNGGVDTGVFTITVNPSNDAPVAVDGSDSVDEDAANPLTGSLVATDADADNLTYALDVGGDVLNGTLTLNPDGTFEYTPNANFHGSDSFTWTVSDGNGGTDTGTFEITVNSVNDQPLAAADINLTADEDPANPIAIDVLTGASDADLDTLSVATVNGEPMTLDGVAVGGGLVTVGMDGNLLFTAAPDFHGTVSFTYTLTDGSGAGNAESDPATVEIVIAPVNDAPVGQPFDLTMAEDDGVLTIDVLGAATDIEGDTVSVLEVNGTLMDMDGVAVTGGVVTLDGDGNLVFSPDENFNGPVSFTYTLTDGSDSSTPATVDIDVTSVNDTPTAANFELEIDEDPVGALTINVVGGGFDVEGDTLSLATVNGEVVDEDGVDIGNGIITRDLSGNLLFTPTTNFNGAVSFTYALTDGEAVSEEGAVDILINPVNDRPISADLTATASEDGSVTIDPFETAQDVEFDGGEPGSQPLAVSLVNGEAVDMDGVDVGDGVVTLDLDGKLVFTPDANFSGEVSFTYTLTDGDLESVASTVTVTVTPVNDAPTAADFSVSIDEDTSATFDVLGDGTDADGDTLSVATVNGEVVDMDGLVIDGGVITINGDGNIVFTPDANVSGAASFTYTLSDGTTQSNEANVDVAIAAVNDAPVAADDSTTLAEDAATYSGAVSAFDVEGDDVVYSLAPGGDPAHGTLLFNGDGTFDYTPDADFSGEDSFTWSVNDGNGGTDTGTFTITVTPVNDAPTAPDISTSGAEDGGAILVDVFDGAVDADSADQLSVNTVNGALLTPAGVEVDGGLVTRRMDGRLEFTPNANFNGAVSFTYTLIDDSGAGNAESAEASVDILVTAVNDAPILAGEGPHSTDEDTVLTGQAATPTDIDNEPVDFSYVLLQDVDGLTFDTVTGAWSFDPTNVAAYQALYLGQSTTVSFTYAATDGDLQSDPVTVQIAIAGATDAVNGTSASEVIAASNFVDLIYGGDGDDFVSGLNGSDTLFGEDGDDILSGGANDDTLNGGSGGDTLIGGSGNDTLAGGEGDDDMVGGNGTDVVTYASATQAITANLNTGIATGEGEDSIGLVENLIGSGYDDVLTGSTGANSIWGGNGLDTIDGGDGLDRLYGEDGSDTLYGGVGSDILDGGAGDDFIYGGIGNDTLTGGSGADRFVFLAESFTTPLQTDTILDFNVSDGDVLDMSAIDANASIAGDQAFSRVGSFTGVAGQATVVFANNQTIIRFDLNGDRATDFQIRLDGDHTGTALLTGAEAPGTGGWIF
jgi:VCBS repeat-containing protein